MDQIVNLLSRFGAAIQRLIKDMDYVKTLSYFGLLSFLLLMLFSTEPSFLFNWNHDLVTDITDLDPTNTNLLAQMIILVLTSSFVYTIAHSKRITSSIQYLIATLLAYFLLFILISQFSIVLNLVVGMFGLACFWIIGVLTRLNDEKSEVFGLKKAVSQYVSPQIMNRVLNNPKSLQLGGRSRTMTVLFSDIRNFTSISEKVKAKKLIEFVNEYFNSVTKTILKNDGTIDKFAGDSLMAFWNAPLKEPDHAYIACNTALEIREDLRQFNITQKSNGSGPKIATGIGINTGKMTVGNVGSKDRFDYTVIGDEVNTAARLEGMTKMYKVPIILGHNTVLQLKRSGKFSKFSIRLLDIVKAKGKKKKVGVYELMGPRDKDSEKLASAYEQAFERYQEGKFEKATKAFIQILSHVDDHPSIMMLVRCYQFLETPPSEWDGIWEWGKK